MSYIRVNSIDNEQLIIDNYSIALRR